MAFRPSKIKKHRTSNPGEVSMTSLMDAMTILLVFLLKTYSTSGQIITPSNELQLPRSMSTQPPHKELTVSVTRDNILVADQRIMTVEDVDARASIIRGLFDELSRRAGEAKEDEIQYAIPFSREIIIMADENVPFQLLFKVIYTCGSSEYSKIRLLTIRGSSS